MVKKTPVWAVVNACCLLMPKVLRRHFFCNSSGVFASALSFATSLSFFLYQVFLVLLDVFVARPIVICQMFFRLKEEGKMFMVQATPDSCISKTVNQPQPIKSIRIVFRCCISIGKMLHKCLNRGAFRYVIACAHFKSKQ